MTTETKKQARFLVIVCSVYFMLALMMTDNLEGFLAWSWVKFEPALDLILGLIAGGLAVYGARKIHPESYPEVETSRALWIRERFFIIQLISFGLILILGFGVGLQFFMIFSNVVVVLATCYFGSGIILPNRATNPLNQQTCKMLDHAVLINIGIGLALIGYVLHQPIVV